MAKEIAIIGGGPAGLAAAEYLAGRNFAVTVYERMPSCGRKFLMAGRGGLNLTHTEPLPAFLSRYRASDARLEAAIRAFTPQDLRDWAAALGQETFAGTSGRVFPSAFKASPLLRAWLSRLEERGVTFRLRHEWKGFSAESRPVFTSPQGEAEARADAVLLAPGGASWPRLGSDGGWTSLLPGVDMTGFRPANCGFFAAWSDIFRDRFAGMPLKPLTVRFAGREVKGEAMVSANGIEGGAIYALSHEIRSAIEKTGQAVISLDLRPGLTLEALTERLSASRRKQSFSTYLKKAGGLGPVQAGLVMEAIHAGLAAKEAGPGALAALTKDYRLRLTAPFPIERAISTAGGIAWGALDDHFMLTALPGVFAAGEMIEWEAPTGGYLLQATFATGIAAAKGVERWLTARA